MLPNESLGSRPCGTLEFSIIDLSGVCIAFVEQKVQARLECSGNACERVVGQNYDLNNSVTYETIV